MVRNGKTYFTIYFSQSRIDKQVHILYFSINEVLLLACIVDLNPQDKVTVQDQTSY